MSYTPTLVINRDDLERAAENWDESFLDLMTQEELIDDGMKARKYLLDILRQDRKAENYPAPYTRPELKIGGVRLIICEPDFTSINEAVRDYLTEAGIEFGIDN